MDFDALPQSSEAESDSEPATRALLLSQNGVQAHRLEGYLRQLGVACREVHCASGAAAVLRREDLRGRPIDLLLVDGQFGGICGMNLCAALCMPLRHRPVVLLTAPLATCLTPETLTRSGVTAVLPEHAQRDDIQILLQTFLPAEQTTESVKSKTD